MMSSQLEFLNVNTCKESSSHNKLLRFRYEPEGTRMFLQKKKEGYILSKNVLPKGELVEVKKSMNPIFLYIPVLHKIKENGYISIFRQGPDSYFIRPSTKEELNLKMPQRRYTESGHIVFSSVVNGINLTKPDYERLSKTGLLKMHIVSGNGKLYAEATPISEIGDLPSLSCAASPYGGWEHLKNADEYTYARELKKNKSVYQLPLPISFIQQSELNKGDKFHTYFREDGTFLIEPHPLTCDICGSKINRYLDTASEVHICKSCQGTLPVVKKLKNNTVIPYKELHEELAAIKSTLTQLIHTEI